MTSAGEFLLRVGWAIKTRRKSDQFAVRYVSLSPTKRGKDVAGETESGRLYETDLEVGGGGGGWAVRTPCASIRIVNCRINIAEVDFAHETINLPWEFS
jgi:hypothetical protein